GLSALDLHSGRFRLLTPRIAEYGTQVEKIVYDASDRSLLLKVGFGQGRLIRIPAEGRPELVPPPKYEARDHTRFDRLDTRDPKRRWMEDFTLSADGEIWAATQQTPAGVYARLGGRDEDVRFLPARDRLRAPEL